MKTMINENGWFARWMPRPRFAVATLLVAVPGWAATINSVEFS